MKVSAFYSALPALSAFFGLATAASKPSKPICAPGYYRNAMGCNACPAGTYNPKTGAEGSINCLPCSAGYHSSAGAAICDPCQLGTYTNTTGTAVCTVCPDDKSTQVAGATSESQCSICKAGTIYEPEGNWCMGCPSGSYSHAGDSICTMCPTGYYAPSAGNNACIQCPAGTTTSGTGAGSLSYCVTPPSRRRWIARRHTAYAADGI